jgi:hypothetical protein
MACLEPLKRRWTQNSNASPAQAVVPVEARLYSFELSSGTAMRRDTYDKYSHIDLLLVVLSWVLLSSLRDSSGELMRREDA